MEEMVTSRELVVSFCKWVAIEPDRNKWELNNQTCTNYIHELKSVLSLLNIFTGCNIHQFDDGSFLERLDGNAIDIRRKILYEKFGVQVSCMAELRFVFVQLLALIVNLGIFVDNTNRIKTSCEYSEGINVLIKQFPVKINGFVDASILEMTDIISVIIDPITEVSLKHAQDWYGYPKDVEPQWNELLKW